MYFQGSKRFHTKKVQLMVKGLKLHKNVVNMRVTTCVPYLCNS